MPMSQAVRLCPSLVIVPPNFPAYHQASARVMAVLHDLTPFVEQISIDEAFLDVTMLPGEAEVLARRLQALIRDDLGLPCSLGVASNKLVAKVATNIGKAGATRDAPPNAILVVPPGEEAAFLAPLPIRELWGVGPKTAERLARLGIHTIGDIARWPSDDLAYRFGKHGEELAQRARGIDDRPVEPESETKSVSKEITFARDARDAETLRRTLRSLAEGVGRSLRHKALRGSTVRLKLRWSDFTTISRQITLPQPTDHDADIVAAAFDLFEKAWPPGQAVRLIGVGVSGFDQPGQQPGLWDTVSHVEEQQRLETALDKLRDRFGESIIRRASDLLDED